LQYLWPDWIGWNAKAIVTFMCLGNAAALLFARSFFGIPHLAPRLNYPYIIFIAFSLFSSFWGLFSDVYALYAAIFCVLATVILVPLTIIIGFKIGYRPTRFFAAAWILFLFGVFVSI